MLRQIEPAWRVARTSPQMAPTPAASPTSWLIRRRGRLADPGGGLDAFLAVFDEVTLADVALTPDAFLTPAERAAAEPGAGPAKAG